ncbi:MAG: hypothetical protein NZ899_05105 [Thermoguttaceae bacterium]|nr:hypothetical protein [Thermoguttaceae bacterium]MDW8078306.1 DUF6677 family protein [Thermoguttaceae bacterium]
MEHQPRASSPRGEPPRASAQMAAPTIELRDPWVAAFLAWVFPGLGHLYQGRTHKAILFSITIMTIFVWGLFLGGSRELGWGRVVYFSMRPGDRRLWFFGQMWVGVPVLPAIIQAIRVNSGKEPLWHYFMAPPILGPDREDPQDLAPPYTLDTLQKRLHRFFDLGTVYTAIAGLLNILVIYDAWGGPVAGEEEEHPDEPASEG